MSLIFSWTCCPSAILHIRTFPSMRAATTPGSHCRVAGMSANTAQTSSGVALMSMVLLIVGMCLVPFPRVDGLLTVVTAPCWQIHRRSRPTWASDDRVILSGRPGRHRGAVVGGDGRRCGGIPGADCTVPAGVHCYRMLGSLDDADDAVQETLLKAWRRLAGFEGRSALPAWLYRIATNVCLDALDHRGRRILPTAILSPADPHLPPDRDDVETPWLQPFPDALLEVADPDPLADPAKAVVRREHIELAFIAALQYLPVRQRAVLMLREVLGFSAAETAEILDTTPASVNSALQRARNTLDTRLPGGEAALSSPAEQADLVARYVEAWHAQDVPSPCSAVAGGRLDGEAAHPVLVPETRSHRHLPTAAVRQPVGWRPASGAHRREPAAGIGGLRTSQEWQ
jgi:RNA polymerase sigma factor (sigma-70 family)